MHPAARRCSSVEYSRYSPSSRLDRRAPRPSWCFASVSPRAPNRHLAAAVPLHYVERPAPAPLADVIECVWSVSDRVARAARPPDRVIPDGRAELIVHRGDRYRRLVDGRVVRQPAAFLAGTLSRPWIVQAPARIDTVGVRLRPGGFTALFGASLAG